MKRFAVLDFETAGTNPSDGIIEIGLTILENGEEIAEYNSLVNPGRKIPLFIQRLTGINDTMVSTAPSFEDIIPEFLPLLEDTVLVAHNAAFDVSFLQYALEDHGYSPFHGLVIDTVELARILFPQFNSIQLSSLTAHFGIIHEEAHRALSDAKATGQVLLHCIEAVRKLPLLTLQRLTELTKACQSDIDALFSSLESERMLNVPSEEGYSFRQFALNVQEWTTEQEVRRDPVEMKCLTTTPFDQIISDWRVRMEASFAQYERRESQERMMQEVFASLDQSRHMIAEAGTGTGKSLGYLLPSLYWSLKEEEKVVVSTHTINLQEQIFNRDVPLLKKIFPLPFEAAVLKGRNNYLCLRKFEQSVASNDLDWEDGEAVAASEVLVWLGDTKSGDVEEIQFNSKGNAYWKTVQSDADSCLNRACPWFRHCFYHRARNRAGQADVVITNHSLLFTDLKADYRILPTHRTVIIDEAHHLEDVASQHLGVMVTFSQIHQTMNRLYKDGRNGHLAQLIFRLRSMDAADFGASLEKLEENTRLVAPIREEFEQLFSMILRGLEKAHQGQSETGQMVYRIHLNDHALKQVAPLKEVAGNLHVRLTEWLKSLEREITSIRETDGAEELETLLTDMNGSVKDMFRLRDGLQHFFAWNDENTVYWIEGHQSYGLRSIQLQAVPTDVSQLLYDQFFKTKNSVVLTSATLSVDQSFDYVAAQLGLVPFEKEDRLRSVLVDSPFEYEKQSLLCVPKDFPNIKDTGEKEFAKQLTRSLREVAMETKGRMLVLFTSYRMLKEVHSQLKGALEPHGIEVIGQGVDGSRRTKLTERFQSHASAVLLGTSSFWEGVDIPGEALSCLAIVRLPFWPPNHPVMEAKSERLKRMRKNPFMDLSVPQAVIRFKQGFGRLIRSKSDHGVVIVYDTRLMDTFYGKKFIESLPGPKLESVKTEQLSERIREWMANV